MARNKEAIARAKRRYYEKNREQHKLSSKRYREKKRDFIRTEKARPCTDCGVKYEYYVMDFDHLGDKSFSLANYINFSIKQIVQEITKCEVVCANCHRIRTYNRKVLD